MNNKRYIEAFNNIKASDDLKNKTYDNILNSKRSNYFVPKLVLALSIILVLGGTSFYQMYHKVTSIISIDINPSLEIYINRFDRVIDVKGFNDDGNKLSNELDIINDNYNKALDKISLNNNVKYLIDNGEEMSITVALLENKNKDLINDARNFSNCHKNSHFSEVNHHEVKEAHHNNLSCGKYKLYLELKQLDSDITIKDIEDLTTNEILEIMESYGYNYDNHHSHSEHHRH